MFQPIPVPAAVDADKLPASIGGPTLRAAAAAGNPAAEYEVASRFAEGRSVAVSNEQAAHWLQRAADQGLAPAQFRLGGLYEKGIGVKKDLAKARDLYAAAGDKGNGKAMHNLAVLYAEGINGTADYKTAAQWFRKAADRGITDSQYNLAILYARGIGVEQNYAESYKWFTLAANRGDADAGKKRDEIATHLDAQSLQAAQTAAQKWTATAQPDEAINVKTPAGGWDPQTAKPATKPKPAAALRASRRKPSSKNILLEHDLFGNLVSTFPDHALIRQTARCRHGIEPPFAEHMRGERQRRKQRGDGAVAHIEPAGIGAEGRHDQPPAVAGETTPPQRAAALHDAGQRMQMSGDLAIARLERRLMRRLVAKRQPAKRQPVGETAADIVGRIGIVIAGKPDPVAAALQGHQRAAAVVGHARRTTAVVKAVAQRHDKARRIALDQPRQPRQGRRRIVGRQQHAAGGIGRTLLQMQIGGDEQFFVRPIERAGRIGDQRDAGDGELTLRSSPRRRGPRSWIPACAGMSG